ncbi:MAG: CoA transferase [Chloroflexota bacterium]|nr:CoA transferase [Chloroflexota bacterium]
MPGPLDGYRVVEIAEGVAGPYTAMSLGDAGADVIKIEPPQGDRSRGWAPSLDGDSSVFRTLNRSKRGIVLDWSSGQDIETARRLLAQADVAVVDKYGLPPELGWERLNAPGLVYCAISGFGPQGPWADRPASEIGTQMASEATSSLGNLGEPPVRHGSDIGSVFAANNAIQAICAALYARDDSDPSNPTGGQRVEVSLFGSLIAMRSTLWVALSNPDEWWGFHLDSYVKPPDHGYQCRDLPIYFSLARIRGDAFESLIDELGMDWAREHPDYEKLRTDGAGGAGRYAAELKPLWERGFANFNADRVMEIVERHGGWAFPMHDYERLSNDPQVDAVGAIINLEQTDGSLMRQVAPPWDFEGTPVPTPTRPAPALGEHQDEVLAELVARS